MTESKRVSPVPDVFWEEFQASSRNGTAPAVLQCDPLRDAAISVDEGIEILQGLLAAEEYGVNCDGEYRGNAVVPTPPSDASKFETFVEKLADANSASAVTLTRDYCLTHSAFAAAKVRAFADGYVKRYGLPSTGINAVFICGRYRETWIGLHNDSCWTFLFPLLGRKRMLIWEPSYFANSEWRSTEGANGTCFGHVDISTHERAATVYNVSHGELLFIPPHWWHYNKLERNELSMTVSLGVFDNATVLDWVRRVAGDVVHRSVGRLSSPDPATVESISDLSLPDVAAESLHEVESAMKLHALVSASGRGLMGGRGFRSSNGIDARTRLTGRSDAPVYAVSGGNNGILIASGTITTIGSVAATKVLGGMVNRGTPFQIAEADCDSQSQIIDGARWLFERGAIEIAPDATA